MSKNNAQLEVIQPSNWIMNHLQMRDIQKKIEDFSGLSYGNDKDEMLRRKIVNHVDKTDSLSFKKYLEFLNSDQKYLQELINEVTINETYLYRDEQQLDFWKNQILLPLLDHKKEIKIWSAACSSGEEPTTIALILEQCRAQNKFESQIYASDINSATIEKAKLGEFNIRSTNYVPQEELDKYFQKTLLGYKVNPEIIGKITFFEHNLLNDKMAIQEKFDFIFLRNVMIYFSDDTRIKILDAMHELLNPKGCLLMGHCESPISISNKYERFGATSATIFRKV